MLRDVGDSSNHTSADDEVSLISARLLIDIHVNHAALSMLIYLPSSGALFFWRGKVFREIPPVKYAPINHAQVMQFIPLVM